MNVKLTIPGANKSNGVLTVLRPVQRTSLSASVADSLAAMIEKQKLRPGQRLPPERELSELFQVSRSTVREAVKTLESRGLLEGRHGEGRFIRQESLERLVQWSAAPISVSEHEVHQLYEVRDLIEPGMVALAAERISARELRYLRRMLDRHARRLSSGRYTSADDSAFHHRVAAATENPVLIRLLDGVMEVLNNVRDSALRAATGAGMRISLERHEAIYRALAAHDAAAAQSVMSEHLTLARATAIKAVRRAEGARAEGARAED